MPEQAAQPKYLLSKLLLNRIFKLMKQAICAFVLLSALPVTAKGQQDSISMFATTIRNMSLENNSCGKVAKQYIEDLTAITIDDLDATIKRFVELDSLTLKSSGAKKCKKFADEIKQLDKWLVSQRANANANNRESTLFKLFYLEQRIKGLVQVTAYASDIVDRDTLARASLTFAGKDVVKASKWEAGKNMRQFFAVPGNEFILIFNQEGYPAVTEFYSSKGDTTILLVVRKRTIAKTEPEPAPVPHSGSTLEKWLYPLLAVLVGSGIGYQLGKKSRQSPIVPPPPIQEVKKPVVVSSPVVMHDPRPLPADSKSYFESEVLVSAGPRKARGDETDLGEDVCGLATIANKTFFWLMDGTSDGVILRNPVNGYEYFSSRLLAQSIAIKARARAMQFDSMPMQVMIANVMQDVRVDWLRTIEHLPEEEKTVLLNNVGHGKKLSCSTTVLLGSLSLSGDLITCRTGDSKLLLFGNENGKLTLLQSSLGREKPVVGFGAYLVLSLNNAGKLDLTVVEAAYETISEGNVNAVIGFSDGLNSRFEKRLSDLFTKDRRIARQDLVLQPQDLGDDMSYFTVEIKANH
jgi:hypothetical protein